MTKITLERYHGFLEERFPTSFVVDAIGIIYMINQHCILKLDHKCCEVYCGEANSCGDDIGNRLTAKLRNPSGLGLDDARRSMYILDKDNHKIKKIAMRDELVSDFAGNISENQDMQSFEPSSIVLDKTGNLYVLDIGPNPCIWKISPDGVMEDIFAILAFAPRCLAINFTASELYTTYHSDIALIQNTGSAWEHNDFRKKKISLLLKRFSRHHQIAFGLKSGLLVSLSSIRQRKYFDTADWAVPYTEEFSPNLGIYQFSTLNGRIISLSVYDEQGQLIEPRKIQEIFKKITNIQEQTCTVDRWGQIYFMTASGIYRLRGNIVGIVLAYHSRLCFMECHKIVVDWKYQGGIT